MTVSAANPTLAGTQPAGAITLTTTAPVLKDSAVLAGGYYETGSITFTLVAPNGATVDTETVPVNGNGTYSTPKGYTLPATGTIAGSYQWNVSYGGDSNNSSANDTGDSKQRVTVDAANPTLAGTLTSSATTLGTTAPVLKDSAVLAGGYYETGSITFTLVAPNGTSVDTETVPVNGNGTYSTPTGYTLPTAAGRRKLSMEYQLWRRWE